MKKWIADLESEINRRVSLIDGASDYMKKRPLEIFEECLLDERYMLMANALQLINFVEHGRYPMAAERFGEKIEEWRMTFMKPTYSDSLEEFCYKVVWDSIVYLANASPFINLQAFDFE